MPAHPVLARRQLLALFGVSAGSAVLANWMPSGLLVRRRVLGVATARAAEPSCVVRPEMTEGPYFVDERLDRSDIRSDPGTGAISPGVRLALTCVVSRIDGSACTPFQGVLVDLWHCDAAGLYSDVRDARFDTTGRQFLRGYQVTDGSGEARFITIYPGWYLGRTVHMHFKIRTDPGSASGLELTSQLFFDDALTDVVHAQPPYATTGRRTRNAGDGIYRNGGDQLLLSPSEDGAGGYVATFEIGLRVTQSTTTTTSPPGTTTTTTLAPGSCATITACLADLRRALPDPAVAATTRARRTAQRLANRVATIAMMLERAAAGRAARRARRYARARAKLRRLLAASRAAARQGALEVPLAPIEASVERLLDLV